MFFIISFSFAFLASPSRPGSAIPPPTSREPSASTTCETSYFSSPRGSFRSPRFPNGYPATHCIYTFVQLRGFCSLKLYFRDFDLLSAAECIVDYFELEGRRYCDGQLFQLTRNLLKFHFIYKISFCFILF